MTEGQPRPKMNMDRATDTEMALTLIAHTENPCETLDGHNIRDFYIREARRALETMTNPHAKAALEAVVARYAKSE